MIHQALLLLLYNMPGLHVIHDRFLLMSDFTDPHMKVDVGGNLDLVRRVTLSPPWGLPDRCALTLPHTSHILVRKVRPDNHLMPMAHFPATAPCPAWWLHWEGRRSRRPPDVTDPRMGRMSCGSARSVCMWHWAEYNVFCSIRIDFRGRVILSAQAIYKLLKIIPGNVPIPHLGPILRVTRKNLFLKHRVRMCESVNPLPWHPNPLTRLTYTGVLPPTL